MEIKMPQFYVDDKQVQRLSPNSEPAQGGGSDVPQITPAPDPESAKENPKLVDQFNKVKNQEVVKADRNFRALGGKRVVGSIKDVSANLAATRESIADAAAKAIAKADEVRAYASSISKRVNRLSLSLIATGVLDGPGKKHSYWERGFIKIGEFLVDIKPFLFSIIADKAATHTIPSAYSGQLTELIAGGAETALGTSLTVASVFPTSGADVLDTVGLAGGGMTTSIFAAGVVPADSFAICLVPDGGSFTLELYAEGETTTVSGILFTRQEISATVASATTVADAFVTLKRHYVGHGFSVSGMLKLVGGAVATGYQSSWARVLPFFSESIGKLLNIGIGADLDRGRPVA
jgi:hypothetical protein